MNYDQEILNQKSLADYIRSKRIIVDGQVGSEIYKELIKLFPKDAGLATESEVFERWQKLGLWYAVSQMQTKQEPGGIFYVTDAATAGVKDVARFSTAIDQLSIEQIAKSRLVFPDVANLTELTNHDNPFAVCLQSLAIEYGVQVTHRLDDLTQVSAQG